MTTFAERLMSKVEKQPGGCWLWTASTNNHGYGIIRPETDRRTVPPVLAHRAAYELLVEPIPEGLSLDHLCRNRRCVNPAHLEPVTHRENIRRGIPGRAKTHCPRGHELKEPNLYYSRRGARTCRQCTMDRARARREARRDARLIPWEVVERAIATQAAPGEEVA